MGATMNDENSIDTVYAGKRPRVEDFVFDANVAAVFPDMIARSVPGYRLVAALSGIIAARYAKRDGAVYDLGCATGAALLSAHARIEDATVKFIGVDFAAPMLEKCRANLAGVIDPARLKLVRGDARDAAIDNADVVILNFTLQFIAPADRLDLLRRIYAGLNPGGALIVAEKSRLMTPTMRECNKNCTKTSKPPTVTASWKSRKNAPRWSMSWFPTPRPRTWRD